MRSKHQAYANVTEGGWRVCCTEYLEVGHAGREAGKAQKRAKGLLRILTYFIASCTAGLGPGPEEGRGLGEK